MKRESSSRLKRIFTEIVHYMQMKRVKVSIIYSVLHEGRMPYWSTRQVAIDETKEDY